MAARGYLALVLHGHLPFASTAPRDRIARRWLLEALWECYLPLLGVLDRLAADRLPVGVTLSISPPLASMLSQPGLRTELEAHLTALVEINDREAARAAGTPFAAALAHYRRRLRQTLAAWHGIGGNLLAALQRHREAGRVELMTSSASHGYLPALGGEPGAVRAQLRLGRRAFAKLCAPAPSGCWLPECAMDEEVGRELGREGIGYTVVDGHGIERGSPRPPRGTAQPVLGPGGVAYFGRDRSAAHQVWSRAVGYPGDVAYREFYRDLGFERPPSELGPLGAGMMTGLKYYRITGRGQAKQPYEPRLAAACVRRHADHFVGVGRARLGELARFGSAPILVAAYDAELFGHWWFEGPAFVETVLRRLARCADLEATTLGRYLDRFPRCPVVHPASSSWGEGGYGRVWVGPETAHVWRHVHHAHRRVADAVRRNPHANGVAGAALDQAIRELLLMESSDWAFMMRAGPMAPYARARFERHRRNVEALLRLAGGRERGSEDLARYELPLTEGFLPGLEGDELRAPLAE